MAESILCYPISFGDSVKLIETISKRVEDFEDEFYIFENYLCFSNFNILVEHAFEQEIKLLAECGWFCHPDTEAIAIYLS